MTSCLHYRCSDIHRDTTQRGRHTTTDGRQGLVCKRARRGKHVIAATTAALLCHRRRRRGRRDDCGRKKHDVAFSLFLLCTYSGKFVLVDDGDDEDKEAMKDVNSWFPSVLEQCAPSELQNATVVEEVLGMSRVELAKFGDTRRRRWRTN